jgi:MoaA/NifB/PqqE/SkfB family radical SAM enzyme
MNQYINPRAKLFSHADRIAAIKAGGRPAPVNIEIDLSNRCSHGCSWCRFAYTHTRGPLKGKQDKPANHIDGGDLMDADLAGYILTQLSAAGVKSITWTGGGEPTLHPRFNEIIQWADRVGLEQGMYTHGGHIDDDKAHLLKRIFKWVYISLDECTREDFKASKGVDRFDNVLSGVSRLALATGDATVGVGFLLHRGNRDKIDSMVHLGHKLGADYVQFRPVIAYDQAAPGQLVEDAQWVNSVVNDLRKYAGDPFVQADLSRFEWYRDWNGHGYATCNWSALQTVITPNGKVWRCTDKREHADALLGDLSVESFADVWARAGGPCQVNAGCRLMCRGHVANVTLDAIMARPEHGNFI